MTEIQKTVRAYLNLPTHIKCGIWKKIGFEQSGIRSYGLDDQDKYFFDWVKIENKLTILTEILETKKK